MSKKTLYTNNPFLICCLVLILSTTVLCVIKKLYSGDEIATFLFATTHANEYQDSTILSVQNGQMIPAEKLKTFYVTRPGQSFSDVSADIGKNDWHPPLYFFVLGEVVKIWGTTLYVGIVLNLLFKLFSLFFLYQIAQYFFKDKRYAFFAILIWSLSHASIYALFEARQYELLCALMLGHFYFFMRWITGGRGYNLFISLLFTTGAYLTHYTFLPVSAGLVAASLVVYRNQGLNKPIVALGMLILACLAFLWIHPYFLDSLTILEHKNLTITAGAIVFRIGKSVLSIVDFVFPVFEGKSILYAASRHLHPLVFLLITATLTLTAIIIIRFVLKRKHTKAQSVFTTPLTPEQQLILVYAVWLMLTLFGSYVCFKTPQHAMGRKYLAMFFPFWAIVIVYLISFTHKQQRWYTLLALLLGCGMLVRTQSEYTEQQKLGELNRIASAQKIVYTTSFDRRGFARFIPGLQNDAQVFYVDETKLLQDTFPLQTGGLLISTFVIDQKVVDQRNLEKGLSYAAVDSNSFYFYRVR